MVQETKKVYLVWHTDPRDEDEKLTGVYSSREKAEQSIQRLKNQPGFKNSPEGFEICDYRLDKDQWTEGFITAKEALDALDESAT